MPQCMSGCGGEDMTSQKYLPDQDCRLAICRTRCEGRARGDLIAPTLLSSIDHCLAFHRFLKGCGGGAGFAVDIIIVLGLNTRDCTSDEVLFQVVDNTSDFTNLKRGISRDWVDVTRHEPRAFRKQSMEIRCRQIVSLGREFHKMLRGIGGDMMTS
jgi:hypothetical protein